MEDNLNFVDHMVDTDIHAFLDLCFKAIQKCDACTLIQIAHQVSTTTRRRADSPAECIVLLHEIISKCLAHLKDVSTDHVIVTGICDSLVSVCNCLEDETIRDAVSENVRNVINFKYADSVAKTGNNTLVLTLIKCHLLLSNDSQTAASDSHKIILEILRLGQPILTANVMIHIIHLLKREDVYKQIWSIMLNQIGETTSRDLITDGTFSGYVILCSLCDTCFVPNSLFSVQCEPSFWQVLQSGLISCHASVRKRSMYALKRAIEHCSASAEIVSCEVNGAVIFCWDPKLKQELDDFWNDVILLLEVLEEKQIHVLKPVLPKMEKLAEYLTSKICDSVLFSSWVLCVYSRMLSHENKFMIRWAISSVLRLSFHGPVPDCLSQFISTVFLAALNDGSIYQRTENGPSQIFVPTGVEVTKFLSHLIDKMQRGDAFVRNVVLGVCEQTDTWGGVALFHVTYALAQLTPRKCLDSTSLTQLSEMVRNALRSQEPLLRGAIQCNIVSLALRLVDPSAVTLDDLSSFFSVLRRSECFRRGTAQWNEAAQWLHLQYGEARNDVVDFCVLSLKRLFHAEDGKNKFENNRGTASECLRLARILVFLDDAGLVENHQWEELMKETCDWLVSAHSRPYLSADKVQNTLNLFKLTMTEGEHIDGGQTDGVSETIAKLILPHSVNVSQWLLKTAISAQDVEQILGYLDVLKQLTSRSSSFFFLIGSALEQCSRILANGSEFSIPETLNCWHIVAMCWQLTDDVNKEKNYLAQFTWERIRGGTLEALIHTPKALCVNPCEKLLSASAMQQAWYCVSCCLTSSDVLPSCEEGSLLTSLAVDSFQTAPHSAARHIFTSLRVILKTISGSLVDDVMTIGWETCMEMRKNELFQTTFASFVAAFFQPCLMYSHSQLLLEEFGTIYELGEASASMFPALAEHCLKVWNRKENFSASFHFHSQICNILTFGLVHRKDRRVVKETEDFIVGLGSMLSVNDMIKIDVHPEWSCRASGIAFLCSLSPECEAHRQLACHLVSLLVDKEKETSEAHSRHFGNSLTHRVKQRCWQALLVLLPLLDKSKLMWLLEQTYQSIAEECQQPSVRYLQEWLAAKILLEVPELQQYVVSQMEKFSDSRLGCAGSFLAVIVLLTCCTRNHPPDEEERLLSSWLRGTLPWCMAQHFNTRLYARAAWTRVYERAQKLGLATLVSQFSSISECLHLYKETGNINKNLKLLTENFYFTSFKANVHYSLETIFYQLPYLTYMSLDECIDPATFQKCFQNLNVTGRLLPLVNEDRSLDSASPAVWMPSATGTQMEQEESGHFQKKITPWTQMEFSPTSSERVRSGGVGGLVVVASLIDKTPNLGGLCRTCEVFGVAEYVIGNMKYVQDKQFQSLSVTAEKWIAVKEVRPSLLKPYLLEMKSRGYTLVGVEQTTHSKDLTTFQFPRNTLLLLGNEREGLPVDLIHLLDVCVEIPQQGVVRSLNVHVSGALLIWEYRKQHLHS